MSHVASVMGTATEDRVPEELLELRERVREQPSAVREALEPLIEDAMEHARFRDRVLVVARGALEQFKLDLELTRFDLDATRREKEALGKMILEWGSMGRDS